MAKVPLYTATIPDGLPGAGRVEAPGGAGDGLADLGWDLTDAEDAIAREVAGGILLPDVARCRRLSQRELREILERPGVVARLAQYKDHYNLRGQQLVAKTWLAATDSLDNIIAISRTQQHRKHYEANIYLLERVWPQTQHVEQNITHNVTADVIMRLIDGIEALKVVGGGGTPGEPDYRVEDDPHLQDGKDVNYGVDLAAPEAGAPTDQGRDAA